MKKKVCSAWSACYVNKISEKSHNFNLIFRFAASDGIISIEIHQETDLRDFL